MFKRILSAAVTLVALTGVAHAIPQQMVGDWCHIMGTNEYVRSSNCEGREHLKVNPGGWDYASGEQCLSRGNSRDVSGEARDAISAHRVSVKCYNTGKPGEDGNLNNFWVVLTKLGRLVIIAATPDFGCSMSPSPYLRSRCPR